MSFCEERLRDVFGWRGCVIFLTHLLTRLHDFCGGEVACFFVWRGGILLISCMIFLCGEVA